MSLAYEYAYLLVAVESACMVGQTDGTPRARGGVRVEKYRARYCVFEVGTAVARARGTDIIDIDLLSVRDARTVEGA